MRDACQGRPEHPADRASADGASADCGNVDGANAHVLHFA
jgi:hypothetical protein